MNRTLWRRTGGILFILMLIFSGCGPKEPTLEERIAQAEALLDAGQLDAAIRLLNVCQELAPERVDILEALAFAHSAQGDPLFSAMIFMQIAELVPEQPEYRLYAAESLRESGDTAAAIEQYRVYLLSKPDDTSIWVTLADIYESKGALPDALECLLAAEQIQARPRQRIRIADLYLVRSNLAQAQAWFSRAVDAPETRDKALLGLLETAVRAKRFADAEAIMGRLDAEYPGRLEQSNLAELRPQMEEWRRRQDQAAAALAAMEVHRATETAVEEVVAVEAPPPETTEASTVVETPDPVVEEEQIVEAPPPPTPVEEARSLRDTGNLRGAVGCFKEALVEDDSKPEIWAELSEVYLELGEDRWAQATANEALRRSPNDPKFVLQYLRAAQRTQPAGRVIEEMEAALRRFPGQPELMLVLARAYANSGNIRNARLLYETFLREALDHPQRARVEAELFELGGPTR